MSWKHNTYVLAEQVICVPGACLFLKCMAH